MKRILPMAILALGLVVAAAFGARLGDQHMEYRQVLAVDADRAKAEIGLPTPAKRVGDWFRAGGVGWLFGSGLILVGAVIARRQIAAEQRGEGTGDAAVERADFPGAVAAALAVIDELEAQLAEIAMDTDCPPARVAIDTLVTEQLGPLVDARGQLIARHGLAAFAEYFGPFAGGERNLARTWSAITDGHAVEARASLVVARANFEQAAANWEQVEAR